MSRPQKIIPPVKGSFNSILRSVAMGSGAGKRAARDLVRNPIKPAPPAPKKP